MTQRRPDFRTTDAADDPKQLAKMDEASAQGLWRNAPTQTVRPARQTGATMPEAFRYALLAACRCPVEMADEK
jgi:hypothetical protein